MILLSNVLILSLHNRLFTLAKYATLKYKKTIGSNGNHKKTGTGHRKNHEQAAKNKVLNLFLSQGLIIIISKRTDLSTQPDQ